MSEADTYYRCPQCGSSQLWTRMAGRRYIFRYRSDRNAEALPPEPAPPCPVEQFYCTACQWKGTLEGLLCPR